MIDVAIIDYPFANLQLPIHSVKLKSILPEIEVWCYLLTQAIPIENRKGILYVVENVNELQKVMSTQVQMRC